MWLNCKVIKKLQPPFSDLFPLSSKKICTPPSKWLNFWKVLGGGFQLCSPLFKQNFILKFQDKICLENILFFSKSLNNLSPSIFNTWFSFSSDQHNYETSSSTQGNLMKLFYKTNRYGKYSITVSAVESWNKIQKQLKSILLKDLSPNKIKTVVINFYFKSY